MESADLEAIMAEFIRGEEATATVAGHERQKAISVQALLRPDSP